MEVICYYECMNEDLKRFRTILKLKSVYRWCTVDNRKESSAEHSWGCLMLADLFLSAMSEKIDRLKVYELLMYHDLVEIEVGDSVLHPDVKNGDKTKKELEGSKVLADKLPQRLKGKY